MSTNDPSLNEAAEPNGSRNAWLFLAAWAAGIVAIVYGFALRLGFNPTDDGFVLSQAYRILHGQVPHRDFISPRPVGSPFLHTLDLYAPLPSLEATRLIGLIEVVAYTLLLASFVFQRPVRRWRIWEFALITVALFVNIHTFPIMGWPTIDGLLFVAAGMVVLRAAARRDSEGLSYIGLLLLGIAPVMKQSFFAAPAIGFVWFVHRSWRKGWKETLRTGGDAFICAAGPAIAYVVAIGVLGGWHPMIRQLTNVKEFDIHTVFFVFKGAGSVVVFVLALLGVGLMFLIESPSGRPLGAPIGLVARIAVSTMVLLMPITEHFTGPFASTWSMQLLWIFVFILVIDRLTSGHVDWIGVALLAVAGMVMISWGYPAPNLVGGSLIVWLMLRIWSRTSIDLSSARVLPAIAAIVAVAVGLSVVYARRTRAYYDLPAAKLTASLTPVAHALEGITTNQTTARYMEDMVTCIKRYPARDVAVLPDNPFIYPALKLHDPFPMDWLIPNEYRSSPERLVEAARALARSRNYLVLFQPIRAQDLPHFAVADLEAHPGALVRRDKLLTEIQLSLRATPITCGMFTGRYAKGSP